MNNDAVSELSCNIQLGYIQPPSKSKRVLLPSRNRDCIELVQNWSSPGITSATVLAHHVTIVKI